MGAHMKTTLEIADPLLREAKALAQRERTTLRALVEEGLRQALGERTKQKPFRLRDKSFDGGNGLTPRMQARGGWSRLREAAYPGFFDDDETPGTR